ncbi:MAG TPA: hypothetical protein VGO50_11535 [Pyrinomonadaceae bacterium]|jgi:hypothetical protein|nr:hypothetical protein [Pyrinomonadaceae bacterium]
MLPNSGFTFQLRHKKPPPTAPAENPSPPAATPNVSPPAGMAAGTTDEESNGAQGDVLVNTESKDNGVGKSGLEKKDG